MTWNPPISLQITDADTGATETYRLANGKYVGDSGKQFVAELFPTCSPESVSTEIADFQSGQIPSNWFSGWSATQMALTVPRIVDAIQVAEATRNGTFASGGFGFYLPPL